MKIIKLMFAPYRLVDNYGSRDYYFTIGQAIRDLPNCSPVAVIGNRLSRRVVLQRIQG
jgi:hypothetical protein